MDISIWSILHDGGLDRILGTVPGNVILHVSLDWVAEEFQTPTGSLDVILNGCTGIEYDEWGSAKQYVGIAELQKLDFQRLEILSASQQDDWVHVVTTLGVLRVRYAALTIQLDGGKAVSLDQLTAAVNRAVAKWQASSHPTGFSCL